MANHPAESPIDPSPGSARTTIAIIVGIVAGMAALIGGLWGNTPETRTERFRIGERPGSPDLAGFAGDRACARCHPGEAVEHAGSGHSQTFHLAATHPRMRGLDGTRHDDPERPGVSWAFSMKAGQPQVTRIEGDRTQELLIDYVFGSGQHSNTFVSLDATNPAQPVGLEHRLTHFVEKATFGISPGQKQDQLEGQTTPIGRILTPTETLKCFGCHTSSTSAVDRTRIDTASIIPNVSCERCHGSGVAHIAAVERGRRDDLAILNGAGRTTADQQMRLCGYCHRHPDRFSPEVIRVDNAELVRHQPVGLMQSACYRQTKGGVSCTQCHDPHAKTSTDSAVYVNACLSCHQPTPSAPDRHPCPVSPRESCLGCHMPRRDAGQGYLLTDHWIRVVREGEPSSPGHAFGSPPPPRGELSEPQPNEATTSPAPRSQ